MFSNFKVYELETTTQLVFHDLIQYDDVYKLNAELLKKPGMKEIEVKNTFEGEIFYFLYNSIHFVTFFEEFGDEVVISIPKPQDPKLLVDLLSAETDKRDLSLK